LQDAAVLQAALLVLLVCLSASYGLNGLTNTTIGVNALQNRSNRGVCQFSDQKDKKSM